MGSSNGALRSPKRDRHCGVLSTSAATAPTQRMLPGSTCMDSAPLFAASNPRVPRRVTDLRQGRLGHGVLHVARVEFLDELVRALHLFVAIRAVVRAGRKGPAQCAFRSGSILKFLPSETRTFKISIELSETVHRRTSRFAAGNRIILSTVKKSKAYAGNVDSVPMPGKRRVSQMTWRRKTFA